MDWITMHACMYVSSSPALHRLYYSESGYEIRYSYNCMKDLTVQVKRLNNYVGVVARVVASQQGRGQLAIRGYFLFNSYI